MNDEEIRQQLQDFFDESPLCGYFDSHARPCGRARSHPVHAPTYDARHDHLPMADADRFARWRRLHGIPEGRCPSCAMAAVACDRCEFGGCPMGYAHGSGDFEFECRLCNWARPARKHEDPLYEPQ